MYTGTATPALCNSPFNCDAIPLVYVEGSYTMATDRAWRTWVSSCASTGAIWVTIGWTVTPNPSVSVADVSRMIGIRAAR